MVAVKSKPMLAAHYAAKGMAHGPNEGDQYDDVALKLTKPHLYVAGAGIATFGLGVATQNPDVALAGVTASFAALGNNALLIASGMMADIFFDSTRPAPNTVNVDQDFIAKCRKAGPRIFAAFSLATGIALGGIGYDRLKDHKESMIQILPSQLNLKATIGPH